MKLQVFAATVVVTMALVGCERTPNEVPKAEPQAQEQPAVTPEVTEPAVAEVPSTTDKEAPKPVSQKDVLTYQGFNDIKLGMSRADLLAEQKGNISQIDDELSGGPDGCQYVRLKAPNGLLTMLEGGKVMRVEVPAGVQNELGVKVGDKISDVQAKFPRATMSNHHYVNAKELTIWNSDKSVGFLIEGNEKGTVESVRVGKPPNIHYSEGCA